MELSNFKNLDIDWEMTPWDAVTLYLEWGNNSWHSNFQPVRSKLDISNYFVVYMWKSPITVALIQRNSEEAKELWISEVPKEMAMNFIKENQYLKGTYPPNEEIKNWLISLLNNS